MKLLSGKKFKVLLSAVLALLIFVMPVLADTAPKSTTDTAVTKLPAITKVTRQRSVPLLVIKLSFDANGNGINDYDPENPKALYSNSSSPLYGEQYCFSEDSVWAEKCFGNSGASLSDYYKEISIIHFLLIDLIWF